MKVRELLTRWQTGADERRALREFQVRLPLRDAARLLALAEMYPGRSEAQLVTELLSVALDELEAAFPYVQGSTVVAEDEQGDPIYEDTGLTPRILALTRKHLRALEQEAAQGAATDATCTLCVRQDFAMCYLASLNVA